MKVITKSLFIFCLLGLHAISAHASNPLEGIMKEMGTRFGQLAKQVSDPAQVASSIQLSSEMGPYIFSAAKEVPDLVLALPAEEQRAQVLKFQRLILALGTANIDLEEALTANDMNATAAAFNHMNQIRQDGHRFFKPPHP